MTLHQLAREVIRRAEILAKFSDETDRLTRLSWSPAMRRANDLVARWMRQAGMTVREDFVGNLIGMYPPHHPSTPSPHHPKTFLIGSHLDTVREAGKYDGILGVLVGIACIEQLHRQRRRLPFHVEVIGFADEEGIRFETAYLASGALTGTTTAADLKRVDAAGVSLADAIRNFGGDPSRLREARRRASALLGYAEVHIEQGPVLAQRNLAVGVVTAITGVSRFRVTFHGRAGHAGTTPMNLRQDALCAAAEFALAAETHARRIKSLVATVGELGVEPGAVNVIPARVRLSLDVRHPDDARRVSACARLKRRAKQIGSKRGVKVEWQPRAETKATRCSPRLVDLMKQAARKRQRTVPDLVSGAGHDAAEMAAIAPATMLFVRCKGGISHSPAESVTTADVAIAISVLSEFLKRI